MNNNKRDKITKKTIKKVIAVLGIFLLVGCGGNGKGKGKHSGNSDNFDLSAYPKSILSQDVEESLAYMGNEERLAYDIYSTLYNYHDRQGEEIKQLKNISSNSEIKHVGIVQDLVRRYNIDISTLANVNNPVADQNIAFENMPTGRYDVSIIQDLFDTLYQKGISSKQAALEVGCMVEVTDVNDLDRYIKKAQEIDATDVVAAFNVLRDGSYNHYWAFNRGLTKMGISEGCAILGSEYAKTEQEYPSTN